MKIDGKDFKPVTGGSSVTYMKPADLPTNGKCLVGTYQGPVESQFGKNYKLLTDDGRTIVVNGCGSLNNAMANVRVGVKVALTYKGKKKLEKGKFKGKEFHDVGVSVNDEGELDLDKIPF